MYAIFCGKKAKFSHLIIAALILLFFNLGARDIWTQEHRWADIVFGMFYRGDFFHPYLGQNQYYDKPLLSYWLIALFAKMAGQLNTVVLRLPSALAGLLTIVSIYALGKKIKTTEFGLLAGWLLLTTFYFIFWSRTSSADMLNVAGTMAAIAWYRYRRDQARFTDFAIFFVMLALTGLCKGLVGVIVPLLVVGIDVLLQSTWRCYLRWSVILSVLPGLLIYLLPFWASSYFGGQNDENGLYLVYRENILRYFQPFDHKGPIYTYFIYLPIYLLPWTLLFIPALFSIKARWKKMSLDQKWLHWSVLTIFLFFTLSGSRRSYYVLPLVPFAILLTADWIGEFKQAKWREWVAKFILIFYVVLFLLVDVATAWYYRQVGVERFAQTLKAQAVPIKPWPEWRVVMLDAESKLDFYLALPPSAEHYDKVTRDAQRLSAESLLKQWPILRHKPANTIFITRKLYLPYLQTYFHGYKQVEMPPSKYEFLRKQEDDSAPVAFIPMR